MTDHDPDLRLQLGRMDGRLSALESRIDRHESFVTEKLAVIDGKLDRVLLDHASSHGALRALRWAIGTAASLAAWAVGHFVSSGRHAP